MFGYRADPDGINVVVIIDDYGNIAVPLLNGQACGASDGTIVLDNAFNTCADLADDLNSATWQSPLQYNGQWPTVDFIIRQDYCYDEEEAGINFIAGDYFSQEQALLTPGQDMLYVL